MIQRILGVFTLILSVAVTPSFAQNEWPREIPTSGGGKITIYEPQPESLTGNKLTGRAAVSVRKTPDEEPVFGAIFFNATLLTDKSSRMAELESLTVTNAKFSGIDDQKEVSALAALIQDQAPSWHLQLSIDELVASIKKENVAVSNDDFKNDPPRILFVTKPSTLVVLDGEPQILNDKDFGADKVVNSPNLIFKEGNQWNLYIGGTWYTSGSIKSGWKPNNNLSAKVRSVNEQIKKQEKENNDGKASTDKPTVTDIIVTTEPAELLQSDGEPDYKSVAGTSLLYVSNSPNEIFKDINSQKTFVLIAGRWYAAGNLNGPWNYVPSDQLPSDFAQIPEGSDKDGVLSNVAGTPAAEEAKIDAEIPQTAKVDRRTATVNVEYDGQPEFNYIEGTSLQLAENANLTVMRDASGNYFALDNGVWFISDRPNGPWTVANDRPRDVEDIPASSPAYNTKYVYIYDQTPDYVYTGYTAGYIGSYTYGRTIVYGTGYHYRPWFRRYYYPRPITWGFGFIYNPWSGWNMNWGYNYGFLYVGFYGGRSAWNGGWFGPSRYRPPYRSPYWGGGYFGRNSAPRQRFGNVSRPGGGVRPVTGTVRPGGSRPASGWSNNTNIYNHHRGVITTDINRRQIATRPSLIATRTPATGNNNRLPVGTRPPLNNDRTGTNNSVRPGVSRPPVGNDRTSAGAGRPVPGNSTRPYNPTTPATRENNILSDRDGNIYRHQNDNWQTRDNRTRDWKPVTDHNSLPDLNRQQQTRERADTRQNNFHRDMPAVTRPSPSRQPMAPRSAPAPRQAAPSRPSQGSRSGAPSSGGGRSGGRPSIR